MQSKLFYGALSALVFGIGIQSVWPLSLLTTIWILFLGMLLALLWRRYETQIFLLVSVCLMACSLGLLRMEVAASQFGNSTLENSLNERVLLTGVVVSEPDQREKTKQFYVEVGEDKLLVSTDRLTDLSYGDQVMVNGVLKKPESFTTDLGRAFDYPGYLKARGVEYQISFAEVEVTGSGMGNRVMSILLITKVRFIESLEQVIPEPAVSLGKGLLLGVKSALGADIEDDFRRAGIIHIVVLSGYNVMLVVAFILFCFSYVMSLRWRLLSGIVAIAAFALLVGLSATVVRASIMASLLLLAQLIGRQYHVLRGLCFAGVMMLISNPYLLLYDVGFQFSFMATLGLVLFIPQFESIMVERGKALGWRAFMLATIATQIAVLPLLMYHIGEVSLIALLVNLLILPIVPIAMLLTFLTGMAGFVSVTLANVIGYVATLTLKYILVIADQFAALPFAVIGISSFPAWGVFVLYGAMILIWFLVKSKKLKETNVLSGWVNESEQKIAAQTRTEEVDDDREKGSVPVFFR